jgi:hypothetical protein
MSAPVYITLALLCFIGASVLQVVQARRQRKRRPEATFTSQASDVVSLDEDDSDRGEDEGPPSKVGQMALVGLGLLIILAGIYLKPDDADFNLKVTYEELGVIKLNEYVAAQYDGQGASRC